MKSRSFIQASKNSTTHRFSQLPFTCVASVSHQANGESTAQPAARGDTSYRPQAFTPRHVAAFLRHRHDHLQASHRALLAGTPQIIPVLVTHLIVRGNNLIGVV